MHRPFQQTSHRPCMHVRGHEGHEVHSLPRDDAGAEHVRVLPQGPLGSPAPRGPRVEPRWGPCGA
jgi:hypothetical protein